MGKYQLPNVSISDDYNAHVRRNSAEPGTDFELAYGSPVYAPYGGTVRVVNSSNANATGRYVGIDLADGNYFRALHLSKVSVKPGQKIKKGQLIGYSGASGFGNDWHYGPHVHLSLWVGTDPIKSGYKDTTDIVKYSNASVIPSGNISNTDKDDEMNEVYLRAKGDKTVYALKNGRKRGVKNAEWKSIKAAYKAAGMKVPYAVNVITMAELATIPNA